MPVGDAREIEMYRALVGCRLAEQAITELNVQGVLRDHHSGLGHEAVAVGMAFALRLDDCFLGTHRAGWMPLHARGGCSLRDAVLIQFGRAPGSPKPKSDTPRMLMRVGLIGSALPMSVGVAMADRMRGKDTVTMSCFGDGASNEGAVHEAMNLAGSRHLPMVFVVENNGFSISMPVGKATAAEDFVSRAPAYGMPGLAVDGNDLIAVHEALEQAVGRARSGDGPSLVEMRTTRWEPHADGIADLRTEGEMAALRGRDCVHIFREALIERGVLSEVEASAIEAECRREVEAAVEEGQSESTAPPSRPSLSAVDAMQLTYAG